MNNPSKFVAFAAFVALSLACAGGDETTTPMPDPVVEPDPAPVATAEPGKIPGLEYPALKTHAEKGDFVLAPSRDFFDKALTDGIENTTFIYYGAEVLEPGDVETKLKSLAGTEFTIPNSLIIAFEPGAEAKKGDFVLGHWESGSGLQRAIVVDDEKATEPKVKYLDLSEEMAKEADQWKADRFMVLEAGRPGVSIGCKKDSDVEHGILVSLTPKKLLMLGFAGKLSVHTLEECQPLDPAATFAVGEKVQAVFVSSFSEGEVTKIEAGKGRMTVKLSTGEKEVSMLDVAKNFESYGKGFEPEKGMREGKGRKGKAGDGEGKAKGKAGGDGEGKGGKGKKGG